MPIGSSCYSTPTLGRRRNTASSGHYSSSGMGVSNSTYSFDSSFPSALPFTPKYLPPRSPISNSTFTTRQPYRSSIGHYNTIDRPPTVSTAMSKRDNIIRTLVRSSPELKRHHFLSTDSVALITSDAVHTHDTRVRPSLGSYGKSSYYTQSKTSSIVSPLSSSSNTYYSNTSTMASYETKPYRNAYSPIVIARPSLANYVPRPKEEREKAPVRAIRRDRPLIKFLEREDLNPVQVRHLLNAWSRGENMDDVADSEQDLHKRDSVRSNDSGIGSIRSSRHQTCGECSNDCLQEFVDDSNDHCDYACKVEEQVTESADFPLEADEGFQTPTRLIPLSDLCENQTQQSIAQSSGPDYQKRRVRINSEKYVVPFADKEIDVSSNTDSSTRNSFGKRARRSEPEITCDIENVNSLSKHSLGVKDSNRDEASKDVGQVQKSYSLDKNIDPIFLQPNPETEKKEPTIRELIKEIPSSIDECMAISSALEFKTNISDTLTNDAKPQEVKKQMKIRKKETEATKLKLTTEIVVIEGTSKELAINPSAVSIKQKMSPKDETNEIDSMKDLKNLGVKQKLDKSLQFAEDGSKELKADTDKGGNKNVLKFTSAVKPIKGCERKETSELLQENKRFSCPTITTKTDITTVRNQQRKSSIAFLQNKLTGGLSENKSQSTLQSSKLQSISNKLITNDASIKPKEKSSENDQLAKIPEDKQKSANEHVSNCSKHPITERKLSETTISETLTTRNLLENNKLAQNPSENVLSPKSSKHTSKWSPKNSSEPKETKPIIDTILSKANTDKEDSMRIQGIDDSKQTPTICDITSSTSLPDTKLLEKVSPDGKSSESYRDKKPSKSISNSKKQENISAIKAYKSTPRTDNLTTNVLKPEENNLKPQTPRYDIHKKVTQLEISENTSSECTSNAKPLESSSVTISPGKIAKIQSESVTSTNTSNVASNTITTSRSDLDEKLFKTASTTKKTSSNYDTKSLLNISNKMSPLVVSDNKSSFTKPSSDVLDTKSSDIKVPLNTADKKSTSISLDKLPQKRSEEKPLEKDMCSQLLQNVCDLKSQDNTSKDNLTSAEKVGSIDVSLQKSSSADLALVKGTVKKGNERLRRYSDAELSARIPNNEALKHTMLESKKELSADKPNGDLKSKSGDSLHKVKRSTTMDFPNVSQNVLDHKLQKSSTTDCNDKTVLALLEKKPPLPKLVAKRLLKAENSETIEQKGSNGLPMTFAKESNNNKNKTGIIDCKSKEISELEVSQQNLASTNISTSYYKLSDKKTVDNQHISSTKHNMEPSSVLSKDLIVPTSVESILSLDEKIELKSLANEVSKEIVILAKNLLQSDVQNSLKGQLSKVQIMRKADGSPERTEQKNVCNKFQSKANTVINISNVNLHSSENCKGISKDDRILLPEANRSTRFEESNTCNTVSENSVQPNTSNDIKQINYVEIAKNLSDTNNNILVQVQELACENSTSVQKIASENTGILKINNSANEVSKSGSLETGQGPVDEDILHRKGKLPEPKPIQSDSPMKLPYCAHGQLAETVLSGKTTVSEIDTIVGSQKHSSDVAHRNENSTQASTYDAAQVLQPSGEDSSAAKVTKKVKTTYEEGKPKKKKKKKVPKTTSEETSPKISSAVLPEKAKECNEIKCPEISKVSPCLTETDGHPAFTTSNSSLENELAKKTKTLRSESNTPSHCLDDLWFDYEDTTTESLSTTKRPSSPQRRHKHATPSHKVYTVDDFNLLKVLGRGSYGKVMLAELKNQSQYFAIKCLKKDVVLKDNDVECTMIEKEVLVMGSSHPYICTLYCTFQSHSYLFFVMEYLSGGDLMFHMQQSGKFDQDRARFYSAEIICALKYLHKHGIIYRDAKLDNICIDSEGHIRLVDFGFCKLRIYRKECLPRNLCGTPDYMAPEIIKGYHYNQSVDWWSFGVLLYEMLTGQSPFSGSNENELFWSVCNEDAIYPRFLSKDATQLLVMLLNKDPENRAGMPGCEAGDICFQPFFRYIDWCKVERKEMEPPFKPKLKSETDVSNFDTDFTMERAALSPTDEETLISMDQSLFMGFTFTNPKLDE